MQSEEIDIAFDDVTVFFFGVAIALTLLFFFIASRTETSKPLALPQMDLFNEQDAISTLQDATSTWRIHESLEASSTTGMKACL